MEVLITSNGIFKQLIMWLTIFKQLIHDTSLIIFNLSLSKFQERVKNKIEERRWWLFNDTDFSILNRRNNILVSFFAAFSACIHIKSTFYPSKFLNYNILHSIDYNCMCLLLLRIDNNNKHFWMIRFQWKYTQNYWIISFQIIGSFITIVTFVLSGPRIRLFKTILQISSGLSSESYQNPSVLIHAKDIFDSFFLLVYTFSGYYNWHVSVSVKLCLLYFNLVAFQINMLYINCVYVLTACFKKINNDLENLFIKYNQPQSGGSVISRKILFW